MCYSKYSNSGVRFNKISNKAQQTSLSLRDALDVSKISMRSKSKGSSSRSQANKVPFKLKTNIQNVTSYEQKEKR